MKELTYDESAAKSKKLKKEFEDIMRKFDKDVNKAVKDIEKDFKPENITVMVLIRNYIRKLLKN